MPKNDYTADAQDALELIDEFGGDANLLVNEALPPANEWDAPNAPVWNPYPTKAVLLPIDKNDIAYLTGSTAVEASAKILVEAVILTRDVKKDDKVEYLGETWTIKSIKPLSPAGVNVLWTLFVGK